jgi:hypothetical protein
VKIDSVDNGSLRGGTHDPSLRMNNNCGVSNITGDDDGEHQLNMGYRNSTSFQQNDNLIQLPIN